MRTLWTAVTSHFKKEGENRRGEFLIDPHVEALDYDSTLLLARQTMALSRRRRCATEHLEGDLGNETSISTALWSWYRQNGFEKEEIPPIALSDLQAVYHDPRQVSDVLKRRMLLTRYFSRTGQLEDCYAYGNIEPFVFGSEQTGIIGLRETFHDVLPFPQRIETVISFNPEIKGFKHQIRYFRALLATYGLAHLLTMKNVNDPLINTICADEKAFARGWVSLAKKMEQLSINPFSLPPDESWLYNPNKVSESALLFQMYTNQSHMLLKRS